MSSGDNDTSMGNNVISIKGEDFDYGYEWR